MRKAQRTVLEMAGLEKALVKTRAELVEAARARRTLEILREQRLAVHHAIEASHERAGMDEMAANNARRNRESEEAIPV
jgi:flagellar biosynthesis chaperone FliJ